jgi:hypothetical protein
MIADRCSPPLTHEGTAPLQVAGITKWYGEQRALADVSFDIRHDMSCSSLLPRKKIV